MRHGWAPVGKMMNGSPRKPLFEVVFSICALAMAVFQVFDCCMNILIRIQQPPSGDFHAVTVALSGAVTGEHCWEQLCNLWGSHDFSWTIGGRDIRTLTPGSEPFTAGATLTARPANAPSHSPVSEERALFVLRVLHGPDSQTVFPLTRGRWEIGRQAPVLRINDPALEAVEGHIVVGHEGILYESQGQITPLVPGQRLVLGSSVLVLDSVDYRPSIYAEPEWVTIDVPAPRSKLLLLCMMILPLLLGLVIAWFTKLWFVVAMAVGSSVLMAIHLLVQGREGGKTRRQIADLAQAESELVQQYRGICFKKAEVGVVVGVTTKEARIQGRQRPLEHLPYISQTPCAVNVAQLVEIFPLLPRGSQRLALAQLVFDWVPLSVLLTVDDSADYLRLVEPLLAVPGVQLFHRQLPADFEGLAVAFRPQGQENIERVLFVLDAHRRNTDLSDQGTACEGAFDQISAETFIHLLGSRGGSDLANSRQQPKAHATHLIDAFRAPEYLARAPHPSLWSSELSMHLGVDLERNKEIKLGLNSHGPHFLCAGTTGSGKSQLLRSLLWSLALRYPPQRLAMMLIDFKGGAGLGPLMQLPHTVAAITDLDASLLTRAMKYLRADLNRRKELFVRLGISSYADYIALCAQRCEAPAYPQFVLCIDEFRMLVEDYPDIMQEVIRIATVGRSLGYHLLLATQRPQGAISQDIRTNIATSVCLRVSSSQDSFNVLGTDSAASLPAHAPGRGFVKTSDIQLLEFQAPLITGICESDAEPACSVRFLGIHSDALAPESRAQSDSQLDSYNASISQALEQVSNPSTYLPVPPIPQAPLVTVPADTPPTSHGSLLLGQLEVPDSGIQHPLRWGPDDGPVLLLATGKDRYDPLLMVLHQALMAGFEIICCMASEQTEQRLTQQLQLPGTLHLYTLKDFDFIQEILSQLVQGVDCPTLLVLDGLDLLLEVLPRYPQAEANLLDLLLATPSSSLQIFCTGAQQPRGKFHHIFPGMALSRRAIEADPVRLHNKHYDRPTEPHAAFEGALVDRLTQGRVEAALLVWATLPAHTLTSWPQHTHANQGNTVPQHPSYRWQQLPDSVPISSLNSEGEQHGQQLVFGVLRDGRPALTPQVRGGFLGVYGPRESGKTTLLTTLIQANSHRSFIFASDPTATTVPHLETALSKAQSGSPGTSSQLPILLLDDLDQLDVSVQEWVLASKDAFSLIVVAYTPWPRWPSSPILAALNGTSTGIVLRPEATSDLSFFPGVSLPLDLKTRGRVPEGRALIIDRMVAQPAHVATPVT